MLKWSPDADRLISADGRPAGSTPQDVAVLAVWKVDGRGRHSTIPYKRPAIGGYTHAIFRTEGRVKKMVISAFAAAECPPFYCGGELGAVCCGTDMGNCTDVISGLGSAIAAMLYDPAADQLAVVTKLNMLVLTSSLPPMLTLISLPSSTTAPSTVSSS